MNESPETRPKENEQTQAQPSPAQAPSPALLEHVRKPNIPEHTKKGLLAANQSRVLASNPELGKSILPRYLAGESITAVAKDLGISTEAIYLYLLRNFPEEWKEAQSAKALAKHDIAEEQLDVAADGVSVGRAKEQARLQQWKLERVLRRIYGTDSPGVQINVNVGDIANKIKDLEAELLPAQRSNSPD